MYHVTVFFTQVGILQFQGPRAYINLLKKSPRVLPELSDPRLRIFAN